MRRGFTLVELLVATGLFVMGFSVCLGLFLAGMRQRTAAESHLNLGFAASSLVEEIGMDGTGVLPASSRKPKDYVGWGGLTLTPAPAPDDGKRLYQVPRHPGVWFRVDACEAAFIRSDTPASFDPKEDEEALGLRTTIFLLSWSAPTATLTYQELYDRVRPTDVPVGSNGSKTTFDPEKPDHLRQFQTYLVERKLALRMETVILRRGP